MAVDQGVERPLQKSHLARALAVELGTEHALQPLDLAAVLARQLVARNRNASDLGGGVADAAVTEHIAADAPCREGHDKKAEQHLGDPTRRSAPHCIEHSAKIFL